MFADNVSMALPYFNFRKFSYSIYPSAIRIPFKVRSFVDFIADALKDTPL
jgi:hypothetical protein